MAVVAAAAPASSTAEVVVVAAPPSLAEAELLMAAERQAPAMDIVSAAIREADLLLAAEQLAARTDIVSDAAAEAEAPAAAVATVAAAAGPDEAAVQADIVEIEAEEQELEAALAAIVADEPPAVAAALVAELQVGGCESVWFACTHGACLQRMTYKAAPQRDSWGGPKGQPQAQRSSVYCQHVHCHLVDTAPHLLAAAQPDAVYLPNNHAPPLPSHLSRPSRLRRLCSRLRRRCAPALQACWPRLSPSWRSWPPSRCCSRMCRLASSPAFAWGCEAPPQCSEKRRAHTGACAQANNTL